MVVAELVVDVVGELSVEVDVELVDVDVELVDVDRQLSVGVEEELSLSETSFWTAVHTPVVHERVVSSFLR